MQFLACSNCSINVFITIVIIMIVNLHLSPLGCSTNLKTTVRCWAFRTVFSHCACAYRRHRVNVREQGLASQSSCRVPEGILNDSDDEQSLKQVCLGPETGFLGDRAAVPFALCMRNEAHGDPCGALSVPCGRCGSAAPKAPVVFARKKSHAHAF